MATLLPIDDRVSVLEALGRTRPLNAAESRELDRLLALLYQRRVRLPKQLALARSRVEGLMDRLSPADRLRERRRDVQRAIEALRRLEDELEPGLRLVRVERELGERLAA